MSTPSAAQFHQFQGSLATALAYLPLELDKDLAPSPMVDQCSSSQGHVLLWITNIIRLVNSFFQRFWLRPLFHEFLDREVLQQSLHRSLQASFDASPPSTRLLTCPAFPRIDARAHSSDEVQGMIGPLAVF
ncbi:hypothetical protein PI126_g9088 [Phytophthora idaei]|nr:hypothetical protein PI126_g9088 [Phytophthora idaei]